MHKTVALVAVTEWVWSPWAEALVGVVFPLPVFGCLHAGYLLWTTWQNLPRMRARPVEPPQLADADDLEEMWWLWVISRLQQSETEWS